jgi:2-keto-4-pentenoate hydratase
MPAMQAGCVLGQEVDNWHALDFAHLQGELRCDGETIAICAADPAFDALAALTYVANLLAELGRPLRSGEFVLTGSLHKPYFLNRRGLYQSWVGNVGQVEVAFV